VLVEGVGGDRVGAVDRAGAIPGRPRARRRHLPARRPSGKAMQHARGRIRSMTLRARLATPVERVGQEIYPFQRRARCFAATMTPALNGRLKSPTAERTTL
jgi:hypothetical protein